MYGKKIKYYRLKNGLSVKELALKLNITSAAVSQYENDHRNPDMDILKKLSTIFNVTPLDFLPNSTIDCVFTHNAFRTSSKINKKDEELFLSEIEDKCLKQIEIMDLLNVLPSTSFTPTLLDFNQDINSAVSFIKKALGVNESGPIYSVVQALEKLGIVVLSFDAGDKIEGCNGKANGITYIFFNSNRTIERKRFTMIHEFVHLFYNHLNIDEKELEDRVNKISGMILISDQDLINEFGLINRNINKYLLESVSKEYKIAPSCLVRRLRDLNIITEIYYRNFHKFLSARVGSRKNEPTLINDDSLEEPLSFNQMVYKALSLEIISISKASELLNVPVGIIMENNVRY